MIRYSIYALLMASLVFSSCSEEEAKSSGTVTLKFDHVVGTRDLTLYAEEQYQHMVGDNQESYMVTSLQYYITNIGFVREDKSTYYLPVSFDGSKGFYLIDESKPASTRVDVEVPFGHYTDVVFSIGVPEEAKVPGVGVLSPKEELYYALLGYTNLSLQGTFESETFKYKSIGSNQIANFSIPIPSSSHHRVAHDAATVEVSPTKAPQIHLIINVARFLQGFSLAETRTLSTEQMTKFVENYEDAIIIDHIH